MEKEKMKVVLDQPTSNKIKDVQKFLGLTNYYQQFVKDFVFIARPLYNLIKKDQKWDWTERQEKVIRELKKRFIKEPMLTILNLDKK